MEPTTQLLLIGLALAAVIVFAARRIIKKPKPYRRNVFSEAVEGYAQPEQNYLRKALVPLPGHRNPPAPPKPRAASRLASSSTHTPDSSPSTPGFTDGFVAGNLFDSLPSSYESSSSQDTPSSSSDSFDFGGGDSGGGGADSSWSSND